VTLTASLWLVHRALRTFVRIEVSLLISSDVLPDATGLYRSSRAWLGKDIRIQALTGARRNGTMDRISALVDQCMAEYDEHGCTGDTWSIPGISGGSA
jgi:hypothetical protein